MRITTLMHNLDLHAERIDTARGSYKIRVICWRDENKRRVFTWRVYRLGPSALDNVLLASSAEDQEMFGAALLAAREYVRHSTTVDDAAKEEGDFIPAWRELAVTTTRSNRGGMKLQRVSVDGVDTIMHVENDHGWFRVIVFGEDYGQPEDGMYTSRGYSTRREALDHVVCDHINGNWTDNFKKGYAE